VPDIALSPEYKFQECKGSVISILPLNLNTLLSRRGLLQEILSE
jgi:hypothetical protein